MVVYVIQYHLAAAKAELVNIENQMDPEGGAVSSVPAEAGELSHGTGSSARGKTARNTAAANISETIQRNDFQGTGIFMKSDKSLIKGVSILAAAGIIVKVMGFLFRLPLTNTLGDRGMAYYTPAYDIYAFLLVIATSGLPVAISKMVAERCAVGKFFEAHRVFTLSRKIMWVLGTMGFVILFFGSDFIAVHIAHMPNSAFAMKTIAPALLFVPVMSSYRGFFQGMQRMQPTAVSEVVEQLFRVAVGLSAAYVLFKGLLPGGEQAGGGDIMHGAGGGSLGASAGALAGLIVILIIYSRSRFPVSRQEMMTGGTRESGRDIIMQIIKIAVPITIAASIMPLVNLADVVIVKYRLAAFCSEAEAEALFGQLTSFAAPIIGFPQIIIQAFVMSIVPMISESNRLGDHERFRRDIYNSYKMSMTIALPCAVGMFVLASPVLALFYMRQQESALNAAPSLQIYAVSFIFLAILSISTAILQGLGKQTIPVRNLFLGMLIKIGVTWLLTGVEVINVRGAAIGTVCAYMFAAVMDVLAVRKYAKAKLDIKNVLIKPFVASLIMGVIVFAAYKALYMAAGSYLVPTFIAIVIGVAVYGFIALRTKMITSEEMLTLPKGAKLLAICRKLRLMK